MDDKLAEKLQAEFIEQVFIYLFSFSMINILLLIN